MLILVQEFPALPRVPRPSRPCRVTSAAGHLVVITHQGRGLWWAQPVRPPQALGCWSLSSEGAQLLPALISCGDFLTVLKTPGRLRLWELRWLGKDGLYPHPQLEPHPPQKLSGDLVCRILDLCGVWGGSWGLQITGIQAALRRCPPLSSSPADSEYPSVALWAQKPRFCPGKSGSHLPYPHRAGPLFEHLLANSP